MDAATLPRTSIAGLPELTLAVDLRNRFADYIERIRSRDSERYDPIFAEFAEWCSGKRIRALPCMGDVAAQYLLYLAQTGEHSFLDAVEAAAAIAWKHRGHELPFDDTPVKAVLEYFADLQRDAL